jgi:hypothetical protein
LEEQLKDGTMRISVIRPFSMGDDSGSNNDAGMNSDQGIEG